MLAAMQRQWRADIGTLYSVPYMAWHWHRFARWFYRERIPHSVKAYGCELMIAGLSPIQHAFGFYSHAVSMRAPDFTPNFVKPGGTWGSIGSGARHNWAPHFADNNAFMTVFAHGEVMNPGGSAAMVAHAVAHSLEREPMDSISPIIQVGIVRPATHEIKMLRRQHQGAWTVAQEEDAQANELITGWNNFRAVAREEGLARRTRGRHLNPARRTCAAWPAFTRATTRCRCSCFRCGLSPDTLRATTRRIVKHRDQDDLVP